MELGQRINEKLSVCVRVMEDREPSPSAAVNSQSVETSTMVNIEVGYDGGKQVKGRKRHLLVDTLGLVVMVVVTAANVNDRSGGTPCGKRSCIKYAKAFPA